MPFSLGYLKIARNFGDWQDTGLSPFGARDMPHGAWRIPEGGHSDKDETETL